jgi:hypothetical protein
MPTVGQIIRGPMTRSERLLYRLPLITVLGLGVAAAGAVGVKSGVDSLTVNYGCATSPVLPGSDVLTAAENAADALDAPQDAAMIATVRKNALAAAGSDDVQPWQSVEVCVDRNPVYGFGDSGWMATVSLPVDTSIQ